MNQKHREKGLREKNTSNYTGSSFLKGYVQSFLQL